MNVRIHYVPLHLCGRTETGCKILSKSTTKCQDFHTVFKIHFPCLVSSKTDCSGPKILKYSTGSTGTWWRNLRHGTGQTTCRWMNPRLRRYWWIIVAVIVGHSTNQSPLWGLIWRWSELISTLCWSWMTFQEGPSRLCFLRRLGSFDICRKLLQMFYQFVVASVLFYAGVC